MSYETDSFDNEVVRLLKRGGIGLLPTDTIYGLSARALDESAVEKIHKIKGRDSGKPLIVLISDIKMLDLLSISAEQAHMVNEYWPGSLSVIFSSDAPNFLTRGTKSLAVRLPDYPELLELINEIGPIVSTSANLEGGTSARNAAEARAVFGEKMDFYVDAGELNNPASTLVIIDKGKLKVVRQGAVKID